MAQELPQQVRTTNLQTMNAQFKSQERRLRERRQAATVAVEERRSVMKGNQSVPDALEICFIVFILHRRKSKDLVITEEEKPLASRRMVTVSYTHLTLPTILLV